LGAGGRCHGKCDRSGDAGLLNLTPEQERAARELVAQFLAGKIGDDVALRLFGEEPQRRDSGPARSPATRVKGSPYLYWRGALRYSASIVSKKAVQSRHDESGVSVGAAQKTFLPKTFQESCVFF
jgi:hypothetical protein